MIKYLELTAPEESQFRQAKIISILIQEGDEVAAGDPLFRVMSGSNEIDLPSRLAGKIIELIVEEGENISFMTPLVLLETEVEKSTAPKPASNEKSAVKTESNQLSPASNDEHQETSSPEQVSKSPSVIKAAEASPKSADASPKSKEASPKSKEASAKPAEPAKPRNKARAKKPDSNNEEDQQQSLNLDDKDETASDNSEPLSTKSNSSNQAVDRSSVDPQPDQPAASSDMSENKIAVPDIGIDSAKVIEILVNVGDSVAVDDSLVTLESDKASMDVPSTTAGVVESIDVSVDQDVSEGDILITLTGSDTSSDSNKEPADEEPAPETEAEEKKQASDKSEPKSQKSSEHKESAPASTSEGSGDSSATNIVEVTIPDIGGDSAKVIEIFVKQGQSIETEDPLVTLESDKASMDVPSTVSGIVESVEVEMDQEVSEGTLVAKIASSDSAEGSSDDANSKDESDNKQKSSEPTSEANDEKAAPAAQKTEQPASSPASSAKSAASKSHASPSVRRFARELGAELSSISGTGRKGRITQDDVKKFVKGALTNKQASADRGESSGIPAIPAVDFSKFGEVDIQPLNKIKKLTAANLHRSWLNVPHVTHDDESNISDLESFRKQLNSEYAKQGKEIKLSPLAFIVKAVVNALQTFPQFNASLEPGGENLIYKKYFHIGIAVETPNGLVVPVIRDADKKSVAEIATEMGQLAAKARDKKLTPADMSGSCFTISSLGGIGGTGFTPIVNAPEVAILGVSRSKMQPVWNGEDFDPGMILPLSLSYDHRVIDGAEAARFTRQVAAVLEDVRRLAV